MTQPDDQQPAVPPPPGRGQQQPAQDPQPQSPWTQPDAQDTQTQWTQPHQPQQASAQQPGGHEPQPQSPWTQPGAQQPQPQWGQPQQQPGAQEPQGVPLPPGWGQHQPQGQPGDQTPAYPTPQDPFHTTTMTPTSAQIPPFGAVPPPQAPKKRNLGLIITAVVLGVMLVLCAVGGVGAYLLLRNSEGAGADTARDAAAGFLTAVYKDGNAQEAEQLVCSEARDAKAIEAKIKEIEDQKAKYKSPSIAWDTPKIENETADKADTTVTVRLTTSDEKVSEQTLKLSLVKREGWFVCEVEEQKK